MLRPRHLHSLLWGRQISWPRQKYPVHKVREARPPSHGYFIHFMAHSCFACHHCGGSQVFGSPWVLTPHLLCCISAPPHPSPHLSRLSVASLGLHLAGYLHSGSGVGGDLGFLLSCLVLVVTLLSLPISPLPLLISSLHSM